MNDILKKLKYKEQEPILVMNAPVEYEEYTREIEDKIEREIKGKYDFIQIFAKSIEEAETLLQGAIDAFNGDGCLWITYPKGTSKKYKSDLNRDTARELAGKYNYEPVTLVAIDNDWSALRIKDPDNIKNLTRKSALSEKAKQRIK